MDELITQLHAVAGWCHCSAPTTGQGLSARARLSEAQVRLVAAAASASPATVFEACHDHDITEAKHNGTDIGDDSDGTALSTRLLDALVATLNDADAGAKARLAALAAFSDLARVANERACVLASFRLVGERFEKLLDDRSAGAAQFGTRLGQYHALTAATLLRLCDYALPARDFLEFVNNDVSLALTVTVSLLKVHAYESSLHAAAASTIAGLALPQTYVTPSDDAGGATEEHSLDDFTQAISHLKQRMVSTPLVEQLATALEPRFCFHWAPADRAASRTERMGSLLAGVPRAPELASQSQHATMAALCRCFINVYLFADSGTVAFRQHLLVSGHFCSHIVVDYVSAVAMQLSRAGTAVLSAPLRAALCASLQLLALVSFGMPRHRHLLLQRNPTPLFDTRVVAALASLSTPHVLAWFLPLAYFNVNIDALAQPRELEPAPASGPSGVHAVPHGGAAAVGVDGDSDDGPQLVSVTRGPAAAAAAAAGSGSGASAEACLRPAALLARLESAWRGLNSSEQAACAAAVAGSSALQWLPVARDTPSYAKVAALLSAGVESRPAAAAPAPAAARAAAAATPSSQASAGGGASTGTATASVVTASRDDAACAVASASEAPIAGSGGGSGDGAARDSGDGAARDSGEGAARDSGEGAARGSGEGAARGSGEGAARDSGEGAARGSGEGAARDSGEGAARDSGVEDRRQSMLKQRSPARPAPGDKAAAVADHGRSVGGRVPHAFAHTRADTRADTSAVTSRQPSRRVVRDTAAASPSSEAPPVHMLCAVNGHIMKHPVRSRHDPSGPVFERATIEAWLARAGSVCPITGTTLLRSDLQPCKELEAAITQWHIRESLRRHVLHGDDGEDGLYDFS